MTAPAKPVAGLMDKRFVYVPAAKTNIRETFDRIRREGNPIRPQPAKDSK